MPVPEGRCRSGCRRETCCAILSTQSLIFFGLPISSLRVFTFGSHSFGEGSFRVRLGFPHTPTVLRRYKQNVSVAGETLESSKAKAKSAHAMEVDPPHYCYRLCRLRSVNFFK